MTPVCTRLCLPDRNIVSLPTTIDTCVSSIRAPEYRLLHGSRAFYVWKDPDTFQREKFLSPARGRILLGRKRKIGHTNFGAGKFLEVLFFVVLFFFFLSL